MRRHDDDYDDRPEPRHRLRLALLAMGTAGGLVGLFHWDGAVPGDAAPVSASLGTLGASDPGATAPGADPSPSADAAQPAVANQATTRTSKGKKKKKAAATSAPPATTKSVLGAPVQTEYGTVQVQLGVRAGKIVSARTAQSPHSSANSTQINARALPVLNREVLSVQGGGIDAVSGATVTSGAYQKSLQSALDEAHL